MTERTYPEVGGVDLALAFNYGNWRWMKSMSTRSAKGNSVMIWKCMDCGAKIQNTHYAGSKEGKVTFLPRSTRVPNENEDQLAHTWADKRHAWTKPRRKRDDTLLHPSVHAIFSYHIATGKSPTLPNI